jgi:ribonuclease G
VPFRAGEEVLVEIVEPHMYDADAGVAKIDGYIISVRGAARLVGQKLMVRIDEVGRTAAVASQIGGAAEGAGAPEGGEEPGDDVQSTARRRGRRGGRRRSAAKEPAHEEA